MHPRCFEEAFKCIDLQSESKQKINAPSAEGCVEILDLRGGRIDFVPELISKIDALT